MTIQTQKPPRARPVTDEAKIRMGCAVIGAIIGIVVTLAFVLALNSSPSYPVTVTQNLDGHVAIINTDHTAGCIRTGSDRVCSAFIYAPGVKPTDLHGPSAHGPGSPVKAVQENDGRTDLILIYDR